MSIAIPDDWDQLVAVCAETGDRAVQQGLTTLIPGEEAHGPNPGATLEQISAAEERIGARLDADARQLLLRANGWLNLNGRFTLLSCEELGGPNWTYLLELRDIYWESCPREVWPACLDDPSILIPILTVPYSRETVYVFPGSPDSPTTARPALNTGLDPIPERTLKQSIQTELALAIDELGAARRDSSRGAE